ncbi:MAG: cytidine deaminase [Firmicutes bacterium]|nr:cytidine deaminase [Bacillota bacterium]
MDLYHELLEKAQKVRERAYAPYSNFPVGAALLTEDGEIFTGCNVENASFGLTICAERAAVFGALAAGKRNFTGLALIADTEEPPTPCGACRQVLHEFAPQMWIYCANLKGEKVLWQLRELLPAPFSAKKDQESLF